MTCRARFLLALLVAACVTGAPGQLMAQGQLVLGVPLEPPTLDPTSGAAAAVDSVVYGNLFEGLVRITQSGDIAPALAQSWEVSADGLIYTFRLRRDVRFHDGTAFDAEDVKFSLDRALAPDSTNAQKALLSAIDRVDVIDPYTVRLTLNRPSSSLLYFLGWGDAVIVAAGSAADNASNPVGTGPFRFADWRRGVSIRLDRNADYWGTPAVPASVVFRIIGDPAAAYAAVSAGDIDAYPNYPAPENIAEFDANPGLNVVIGATAGKVIMALNNDRPPFDDVRVRRALSHAIDRQAIIDGALFGFGEPIGSHYSRQGRAYTDLSDRYPHDPARARALLAEAGFADGFSATLRLPPRPYARRSGEVIAAQLAEVGIRLDIENLEWAQWLDQVFSRREFDLTIIEHIEPMDFGIYAREDYYFGYRDDEFDALVAGYEAATDDPTTDEFLRRIQRKLADDAVNVFLVQSAQLGVWKAGLNGLWVDTPIPANVAAAAYFDGREGATVSGPVDGGARTTWLVPTLFAALLAVLIATMRLMGAAWLMERLVSHAVTLLAATIVIFVVLQVVPGDPAAYMMGMNASPESVGSLRVQMGLDAPPLERYLSWLGGLATGQFGTSYTYQVAVSDLIGERLAVSLPLAMLAIVLSLVIALPVGVLAASRRGSAIDTALNSIMQIGIAMPNFWIGLLLILVFSTGLGWFAAGGFVGWDAGLLPALKDLLLPAMALAAPQAAITARVLRTALLETMNEDYVRTARAKGLSRRQALWRHALRNAMIPVLTIIGLQLPFLLAGGIIIENVFSLPGIGRLVFQAITQRDLIVVQNVVFVLVFAVVTVTLLIDIAYSAIDPRLRRSVQ
jgi:ABC-type dipeptide/oligopeptide/nickel transport system permease component/ABC-type transport system substrate-binding protein